MKRFYIWILVVAITFLAVDFSFGLIANYLVEKGELGGYYRSTDYILRHNDNELVVLGSSVALNSFNTQRIEEETEIKSYNGGGYGQTFPFFLTMLKGMVADHKPGCIILALTSYDLDRSGLGRRYKLLNPYYGMGISDIDSNLASQSPLEPYLLRLNSYKYKKIWVSMLINKITGRKDHNLNGFDARPVPPVFPNKEFYNTFAPITEQREKELDEFMRICKENDIDLIIVVTPRYENPGAISAGDSRATVIRLAEKYGVGFYDHSLLPPFANDSTLFYDSLHLNWHGAEIYTDTIIKILKSHILPSAIPKN